MKEKKVSPYPKAVGVITSTIRAVVYDIQNILAYRFHLAGIALFPMLVQDEKALKQK